jgi:ankyrin repeat protein
MYRMALRGNLPALSDDEDERLARVEFVSKVNEAYALENIVLLRKLMEQGQRGRPQSFEGDVWAQFVSVNKKIVLAERRLGDAEREMKRIVAAAGFQLLEKFKESESRESDFIKEHGEKLDLEIGVLEKELSKHDLDELLELTGPPAPAVNGDAQEEYGDRCVKMAVGRDLSVHWRDCGALFEAMHKGLFEKAAKLLASNPWLAFAKGYLGGTALVYAAYKGMPVIVETLLLYGADMDAKTTDECYDCSIGETALVAAIKAAPPSCYHEEPEHKQKYDDCMEIIQMLIDHGAEMNLKHPWWGNTLGVAREFHNHEAFMMLLKAGADPDMPYKSNSGLTLLHCAAIANDVENAKCLLGYGADPEAEYVCMKELEAFIDEKRELGFCGRQLQDNRKEMIRSWGGVEKLSKRKTPLDYAIKGTEMYKLLVRAIREKHGDLPVERQLMLFQDPVELLAAPSKPYEQPVRSFHPMTRYPKLRPPFYIKGSLIHNYYLIPLNNAVNWLDNAFRKLIARIRDFFYI